MRIIIKEYQADWPNDFAIQADKIKKALSAMNIAVEHIGSTSVEGLGAKPIIDILVGLENDAYLNQVILPMQEAGFTYFKKYESSWPERRFFVQLSALNNEKVPLIVDEHEDYSYRKDHFISKANIHIVVKDTQDWKRHIAFRDYLRVHPVYREAYYRLKKKLSEMEFKDVLEYNDNKNDFIKEHEKIAMEWQEKKQHSIKH